MNLLLRRLLSSALLALVWTADVRSASAPAVPVEVAMAKFSNLRAPNGSPGNWYEAAVVLNVRPAPGAPAQMVSRVKVGLLLGFEFAGTAGSERRTVLYRAEAECVALEPGRTEVRFYLPAEIVKRDQLHGDPRQWGVELAVEGRPLPSGRAAYSSNLAGAEARLAFQKRAPAAAVNDGVLVPQYLSPFAGEYPRATPSFVRREMR